MLCGATPFRSQTPHLKASTRRSSVMAATAPPCCSCERALSSLASFAPTTFAAVPLLVDNVELGSLTPQFAQRLLAVGNVFQRAGDAVRLNAALDTAELRNNAIAAVMEELRSEGVITGWRDELFPVSASFIEPPSFLVERAAAPLLGVRAYGVHVNGLVRRGPEELLWVARRSASKSTFPLMLDHLIAGGLPHGLSPMQCLIKEAGEEAGVTPELAAAAVPVGAVAYDVAAPGGRKRDVLFCYDLVLPASFTPTAVDGEVDSFFLLSIPEALERVRLRCGLRAAAY